MNIFFILEIFKPLKRCTIFRYLKCSFLVLTIHKDLFIRYVGVSIKSLLLNCLFHLQVTYLFIVKNDENFAFKLD